MLGQPPPHSASCPVPQPPLPIPPYNPPIHPLPSLSLPISPSPPAISPSAISTTSFIHIPFPCFRFPGSRTPSTRLRPAASRKAPNFIPRFQFPIPFPCLFPYLGRRLLAADVSRGRPYRRTTLQYCSPVPGHDAKSAFQSLCTKIPGHIWNPGLCFSSPRNVAPSPAFIFPDIDPGRNRLS